MTPEDKALFAELMSVLRETTEKLAITNAKLDNVTKDLEELEARIDHDIEGNGQPGLKKQVDRLTQAHERGQWWQRTFATAAVGALVASVSAWLKIGGGQ